MYIPKNIKWLATYYFYIKKEFRQIKKYKLLYRCQVYNIIKYKTKQS